MKRRSCQPVRGAFLLENALLFTRFLKAGSMGVCKQEGEKARLTSMLLSILQCQVQASLLPRRTNTMSSKNISRCCPPIFPQCNPHCPPPSSQKLSIVSNGYLSWETGGSLLLRQHKSPLHLPRLLIILEVQLHQPLSLITTSPGLTDFRLVECRRIRILRKHILPLWQIA